MPELHEVIGRGSRPRVLVDRNGMEPRPPARLDRHQWHGQVHRTQLVERREVIGDQHDGLDGLAEQQLDRRAHGARIWVDHAGDAHGVARLARGVAEREQHARRAVVRGGRS